MLYNRLTNKTNKPTISIHIVWTALLFLLLCNTAKAQINEEDSLNIHYPTDNGSLIIKELEENKIELTEEKLSYKKIKQDSIKIAKDLTKWKPKPKKAVWLAVAIPGGGQIYNRKYWKLPIFYGGIAGCIYAMTWNQQLYKDYSQAYLDLLDNDPNTQSYNDFLHLGNAITDENRTYYERVFKNRKDKHRRWRDLSIFATVAVYALSIIDAYVDASLSDFNISDDLSLQLAPTVINDTSPKANRTYINHTAIGIACKLKF